MFKPDPKCARCQPEDFVAVVMVHDEHSVARAKAAILTAFRHRPLPGRLGDESVSD